MPTTLPAMPEEGGGTSAQAAGSTPEHPLTNDVKKKRGRVGDVAVTCDSDERSGTSPKKMRPDQALGPPPQQQQQQEQQQQRGGAQDSGYNSSGEGGQGSGDDSDSFGEGDQGSGDDSDSFGEGAQDSGDDLVLSQEHFFTHYGMAKVAHAALRNIYCSVNDNGDGYIYDDEQKLWQRRTWKVLQHWFQEHLVEELKKQRTECASNEELTKEYTKWIRKCRDTRDVKMIYEVLSKKHALNEEFEEGLNKAETLLPTRGGLVIDLKTLEVRERTKEDYFTYECPVEFLGKNVKTPHAIKFMKEITNNDAQLETILVRYMGYCMTALMDDRRMFLFRGDGCNGKSGLMEIMREILGDDQFYVTLHEDVLVERGARSSKGSATPQLECLKRKPRMGVVSEVKKNDKVDCTNLKRLTGNNGRIKTRALYGELTTFKSVAKLIVECNSYFQIDKEETAQVDRLGIFPFNARFEKNAKNTLYCKSLVNNHLDEFFTLFCRGAKDYFDNNCEIGTCDAMENAMEAYLAGSGSGNDCDFDQWTANCCSVGEGFSVRAQAVQESYKKNGGKMSKQEFGNTMKKRFRWERTRSGITYFGLKLREEGGGAGAGGTGGLAGGGGAATQV